jgi:hypothetical protein
MYIYCFGIMCPAPPCTRTHQFQECWPSALSYCGNLGKIRPVCSITIGPEMAISCVVSAHVDTTQPHSARESTSLKLAVPMRKLIRIVKDPDT